MEGTSSNVVHGDLRGGRSHIKGVRGVLGNEAEKVSLGGEVSGETRVCQVLAVTALPFMGEIGSSINPGHGRFGRVKVNLLSLQVLGYGD